MSDKGCRLVVKVIVDFDFTMAVVSCGCGIYEPGRFVRGRCMNELNERRRDALNQRKV